MNITEDSPQNDNSTSRARRRKAKRQIISPLTPDEKTEYIESAGRRASPSFDFFLFSFASGAILSVGLIFDSPYILLLGILIVPVMTPIVGTSLGIVMGSGRYFWRSLGSLFIGGFLVLIINALAGFVSQLFNPTTLIQAEIYTKLEWAPFLAIGIGASLTTGWLIQEKRQTAIPSVVLAYAFYLPLASSGFGLGTGLTYLWTAGIVLFIIHLTWAILVGAATLALMGFRPYTLFGYSVGGAVALVGIILVIGFSGASAVVGADVALPSATFTSTPSITPTNTVTPTPPPPTSTATRTLVPTHTKTPTITITPSPTAVEGLVIAGDTGAVMRDEPQGRIIGTLFDGSVVVVLGQSQLDEFNRVWIFVRDLEHDIEGWILQALIVTATPDPAFAPPDTITPSFESPTSTKTPEA